MGRSGRGAAVGSIPADAGCGQTISRQGRDVRAADHELHDALAAATFIKEVRFVFLVLTNAQLISFELSLLCPRPRAEGNWALASMTRSLVRTGTPTRRRSGVARSRTDLLSDGVAY